MPLLLLLLVVVCQVVVCQVEEKLKLVALVQGEELPLQAAASAQLNQAMIPPLVSLGGEEELQSKALEVEQQQLGPQQQVKQQKHPRLHP